jgi:hypothetical protein
MQLATPGGRGCLIYQWPLNRDHLAHGLVPAAAQIAAQPEDTVEMVLRRIPPIASAFLFHIDATFSANFPLCRRTLIEEIERRGIRVISGGATDISKKTIQRSCHDLGLNTVAATRSGDSDEMLIVKTNHNFAAWGEKRLSPRQRRLLIAGELSAVVRHELDYKILRRRQIPEAWWADPGLVVEKFIENSRDRYFKVYIALDRLAVSDIIDPARIKKAGRGASRIHSMFTAGPGGIRLIHKGCEFPERVLSDPVRLASRMGVDFGCLDVVMDESSNTYIIDVNTTPGFFGAPQPGLGEHLRAALNSDGISVEVRTPPGAKTWSRRFASRVVTPVSSILRGAWLKNLTRPQSGSELAFFRRLLIPAHSLAQRGYMGDVMASVPGVEGSSSLQADYSQLRVAKGALPIGRSH